MICHNPSAPNSGNPLSSLSSVDDSSSTDSVLSNVATLKADDDDDNVDLWYHDEAVDNNVLLPDDDKGRIIGADAATIVFFLFVVGKVDEVNDWTTITAYSNPNSSTSMTDADVCFRLFIFILDSFDVSRFVNSNSNFVFNIMPLFILSISLFSLLFWWKYV